MTTNVTTQPAFYALIFGSAITAPASARDVDVMFYVDGVEWAQPAEKPAVIAERLARAWAAERGLSHLPIDAHRGSVWDGAVRIPMPCAMPLPAVAWLTPPAPGGAVADPKWTIAAALRAYGNDPDRAVAAIMTPPDGADMAVYVSDRGFSSHRHDEEGYVSGVLALRNAVRHAPRAAEIFARLPNGRLLAQLVERDPHPAGVQYIDSKCPGGAPRLYRHDDGALSTHYGAERMTLDEAMRLVFEGVAPARAA